MQITRAMSVTSLMITLATGACGQRPLSAVDGGLALPPDAHASTTEAAVPDSRVRADTAPCPGDPNGLVCDIYLDSFSCPTSARRVVIGCKPICQDLKTCAEVAPLPPTICADNGDCTASEYCAVDGHCVVTGAIAGTCTPRPAAATCPVYKVCPEVCGCDGKTYCDACHAHALGVSVATTGVCLAPTCEGLEAAHDAEVQKAKQCCPLCAALQCATVAPSLGCGCDTMVNATTPTMKALRDEWTARGCMYSALPCGIKCGAPGPAGCQPTSAPPGPTSGLCTK
jgi:hypothetical protein